MTSVDPLRAGFCMPRVIGKRRTTGDPRKAAQMRSTQTIRDHDFVTPSSDL
jgi:hypothetical protein